jgi:hypothetical protein
MKWSLFLSKKKRACIKPYALFFFCCAYPKDSQEARKPTFFSSNVLVLKIMRNIVPVKHTIDIL